MRETGSVKTRTSQRGRKHALTPEDLQNIDRVVQQEPDITIDEIIDKLGLHVCNETVRKAVIIAIPENNAKNSALQNVNYCVTDFRRTPVRLRNPFLVIRALPHCLFCVIFWSCYKLGYSYKKKSLHASEQERPLCQGKTQKLEKTYVGERHKSSGLSGRKRSKHQYDATLCQSMEKPESSR